MSSEDKRLLVNELERRYRVADMMVTMHSVLRDRYSRRSVALDAAIFLTSIIIAALVFVDPDLLGWLPWSQESSRVVIGILAIMTFFLSLIAGRVDWKGKSEAHARAAEAFSQAKFRLGATAAHLDNSELREVLDYYEEVARTSIPVPDSQFLQLKARHYMKVRLSRILDRYPGTSLWVTRMRLHFRHSRRALDTDKEEG